MVEIQVNSADLAALAGKGSTPGKAGQGAGGFFAQALAAASAQAVPTADADVAASAGQPLLVGLPAGFIAAGLAGAQLGAAAPGQAVKGEQAASPVNPFQAGLAQGDKAASALFDKLASQLAALGVAGGDAKQVAAQLNALGIGNGDVKQVAAKLAQLGGDGADAKSLETALQQWVQDLAAGQQPDQALLGALAAQMTALQGVGDALPKPGQAADIAADRKALPAKGLKLAIGAGDEGRAVGAAKLALASDAAAAKSPAAEGMQGQLLAAVDEDSAAPAPKLAAASDAFAKALTEVAAVPVKAPMQQTDPGAMRVDGLGMITAPKSGQDVAAQEAVAVRTPLRAAGWDADFAQKVVWMAGRESQSAQLVLNPPQMGTVEVRLTLTGGEAGAQFFSPHHNVREAIESAMPRLREMMAEAGLSLGQASVSSESFRDQRANAENSGRFASAAVDDEASDAQNAASLGQSRHVTQGRGLVDLYA